MKTFESKVMNFAHVYCLVRAFALLSPNYGIVAEAEAEGDGCSCSSGLVAPPGEENKERILLDQLGGLAPPLSPYQLGGSSSSTISLSARGV